MSDLRDYQERAKKAIGEAYRNGARRPLLVLPTGGGKTITSCSLLETAIGGGWRSMFAAHRKELIDQTVRTFQRLGVRDISVVRSSDRRFRPSAMCQVASVQTLARRDTIPGVRFVVIDEAHRAAAATYGKSLFMAYPDARFLGLTATPCRGDGKPLGDKFDSMVVGALYSELIAAGHIVEPIVFSTPTQADLSECRTTGGDYNLEDLEAAVNKGSLIGNLVSEWRRHASDRRTVVFAVSIAHSRAIVDRFREAGVTSEHLDGETPEGEREAILGRLERGETQVVCNVGVLTEGWDCPPVKCIVLARPTKSLALYMQMGGRGLRPWEGVIPIILDHGGNVDRHGMPHEDREWSLDAKPKRKGVISLKPCGACFAFVSGNLRTCPHCGAELATMRETSGNLGLPASEIDDVELRQRSLEESIRNAQLPEWAMHLEGDARIVATFRSLLKRMQIMKYKPGWLRHRFEAATRTPLPRAWAERIGAHR